jgi:hypothetical protein
MKTRKVLLYIGGVIMFLGAILHVTFWTQYNWGEELSWLNSESRGVILAIWIGTIYMSLFAAGISFYIGNKREFGRLEKILCGYMAGIFVLRALVGIPLMGFSTGEVMFDVLSLTVAFCYLFPLRTAR